MFLMPSTVFSYKDMSLHDLLLIWETCKFVCWFVFKIFAKSLYLKNFDNILHRKISTRRPCKVKKCVE